MTKCNPNQLNLLIHGDEHSDEFQQLSLHVDTCEKCQAELLQIAHAEAPWWNDAKQIWQTEELPLPSELIETHSVFLHAGDTEPDAIVAEGTMELLSSFLSKGAHPELLGRLGRYDVERSIGQGGMGIVLKGFDSELHRMVAIKVLLPHLACNSSARRRFAREARAAAAIVHAHVIPIYDVQSDARLPYLVMQYINGPSLQARVEAAGPLTIADMLRVAQQTAAGLAAAHAQGLVHRDVKPANILLEENVERVMLSDFGLARTVDDASLTRTGVIAGTPYYMSPEQAHGNELDARTDLFSLGSVMYFMLTGHPPFRADGAMAILHRICHTPHRPIEQTNADVPYEVARLIDRLLAKEPSERFESASQLEIELKRLLALLQSGGLSLQPPRSSNLGRKLGFRRIAMACGLGLLCFGMCIGWLVWNANQLARNSQTQTTEPPPREEMTVREWQSAIERFKTEDARNQEWNEKTQAITRAAEEFQKQWATPTHSGQDSFWQHSHQILLQIKQINDETAMDRRMPQAEHDH